MKVITRSWQWAINSLRKQPFLRLAWLIAGTWIAYFLILFYGNIFSNSFPLFSAGLSWIWFLAPGFVLSYYCARNINWWERIPIAFVLSIGIATPVTIASILLHLSLDVYILLHAVTLLVSTVISLLAYRFIKVTETTPAPQPEVKSRQSDRIFIVLLIILVIIVGTIAGLSLGWPIAGDDTAILPLFTDVLSQNRITGIEPFHGSGVPVTPRNELIVATYVEILINRVSGITPQEFIINSRPFMIILAILSLGTLLNQLLKDKLQIVFLLTIWNIYLLATLQADKTGSDFITRIFQDKFLGWFIIVPIALVFVLWFIDSRNWHKLVGFGIIVLGASMVHPITLVQIMMLTGGFGLFHFAFNRSKFTFTNVALLAGVLLLCTLVPFMQYIRYNNYMPVELVGLGDAVEFGRLSAAVGRYRLWLLDGGNFILHPAIILQPVIIAGYILLPLIIVKLRKFYLGQLIMGALFLLPTLLYVPFFAKLAGKVVTPFLLWRLAWPFSLFAILTIGYALWLLAVYIDRSKLINWSNITLNGLVYPSVILLLLIIVSPTIRDGVKDYNERRAGVIRSSCNQAVDAFKYLSALTRNKPANVLSSHDLNLCIPGYATNANVLEFRGYGTINRLSYDNIEESIQRVEDASYFNTASLVDDLLMTSLIRHDIDYILIERDRLDLDLQLSHLPGYFQLVYEDEDFRLYLVNNDDNHSEIIDGNTALRKKQYDLAVDLFSGILQKEPQNVLAHLGFGLAEEGLGNSRTAIKSYHQAITFAPYEPALHAQLASAFMVTRDFEDAAGEYLAAINLSNTRADLYKALGEVYVLLGRYDDALTNFERYASLRAINESASYYSLLGRSLLNVNTMTDQAISFQEMALSIQPDARRYLDLARTLVLEGEADAAIEVLQEAIRVDRWNYLPHLELGYIYWNMGDIERTIDEFETACRLNPTNISAYILLGKAIQEEFGTDAAIARMEELTRIDDVLPGPYRSYAFLMASNGDFNSALNAIDRNTTIQPRSAAVFTAKGYISMIAGQIDTAFESFEEALLTYPDLIPAKLGLGMVYDFESNYQMEAGQFMQIVQLVPTASWIHLTLADLYKNQGNYVLALDEVNWAIKLDPDNPDVYTARANIYRMQSDWALAISDYTIALNLDPQNFNVLVGIGEIYQSRGNYAKAEQYFQQAVEADPDSAYALIHLAELYTLMGRIDDAVKLENMAKAIAPDSTPVLIKIANNYMMQGKIEDARDIYTQVIEDNPSAIAAYMGLAQLASEKDNDITMLFSVYNNLLGTNPGSAEAYLASGTFFIIQAQFDLAENILNNSLSFPDVSIDNYLALSNLLERRGKNDAALETLQKAIKKFPGNANGYNSLGYFHLKRGDLQSAGVYFSNAIDLDARLISAYSGKVLIEQIKDNPGRAEKILQAAVKKNPGASDAILALAAYQESIGELAAAEENINQALEINPADIGIHAFAASFYLRQRNYPGAYDQLESALNLAGSKQEIYLLFGELEIAQTHLDEAIEWFEAAISEDQSDVNAYLALANAQQLNGDFTAASSTLSTALQFEPANVDINVSLGELSGKLANRADTRTYFEQAASYDRGNTTPLIALAELEKDQGRWEDAITILKQGLTINPSKFAAYYSLAEIHRIMGNCSEAESVMLTGVQNTFEKQTGIISTANLYEQCGDWEKAREYYDLAWSRTPKSVSAGLEFVNFLYRRNETDQALATLRIIESRTGSNSKLSAAAGKIYLSQAEWLEAEEAYRRAIMLDEGSQEGYLGLAMVYEAQGAFDAEIEILTSAVDKVSDPSELYLRLGTAMNNLGKSEEAYAAYQNVLAFDANNLTSMLNLQELNFILSNPEIDIQSFVSNAMMAPSSQVFTAIAQLYQLRGDWTTAYSWIYKAIYLEPANSEPWFYLGNYYQALGLWKNALSAYTQSQLLNPGSIQAWIALGQVQEGLKLPDEAKDSYQMAILTRPGDISGYVALGKLQTAQGFDEEALNTIQEGILQAPADYRGYEALGDMLVSIDRENFDLAEQAYQTGLDLLPGLPDLYVKIGQLHGNTVITAWEDLKSAGEYENWALSQYQRLINQIGPDEGIEQQSRFVREQIENALLTYEQAHIELLAAQYKYEQTNDSLELAMSSYQKALEVDGNNPQAMIGLGNLKFVQGFNNEGFAFFEKASVMNPYSTVVWMNLGNYYMESGQTEKAIDVFTTASSLEPGNSMVQTALANAYQKLSALSISQAARSAEQSPAKLENIINNLRQKEMQNQNY